MQESSGHVLSECLNIVKVCWVSLMTGKLLIVVVIVWW